MSVDTAKLYSNYAEFFELNGSITMRLAPQAAIEVCENALTYGLLVGIVEGGIWRPPFFEARIDCIWHGDSPPMSVELAERQNKAAAKFISLEKGEHGAFIISTFAFDRPIIQ